MIRIRTLLTTRRHALAALGAIIALGLTVALAHSSFGMDHMGAMPGMDDSKAGHSTVLSMCLAIVEVAGAGVAFAALYVASRRARPRSRQRARFASHSRLLQPPAARARAAPAALLQVYRL